MRSDTCFPPVATTLFFSTTSAQPSSSAGLGPPRISWSFSILGFSLRGVFGGPGGRGEDGEGHVIRPSDFRLQGGGQTCGVTCKGNKTRVLVLLYCCCSCCCVKVSCWALSAVSRGPGRDSCVMENADQGLPLSPSTMLTHVTPPSLFSCRTHDVCTGYLLL